MTVRTPALERALHVPRNLWHFATWAESVVSDVPFARTILDEPVVLFRKADGTVAAIEDRCAHRFAPLSMGKLVGNDRIRCPYHGLEYDAGGACVYNPNGNHALPKNARVRSYPVLEKHSILWIWMGTGAADPALVPNLELLDPDAPNPVSRRDYLLMEASWNLIMDNLLDLSHASYLHEGLLGNKESISAKSEVEQDGTTVTVTRRYNNIPATALLDMLFRQDGANVDSFNSMRWHPPACMINESGAMPVNGTVDEGTGIRGTHFLTPETSTTTHYHFAAVRWNVVKRSPEVDEAIIRRLSELRRVAFKDQDETMIRAQQNRMRTAQRPLKPMLLGIDAGIVRVHRVLDDLLKREDATRSHNQR
jgi:phenylpropionate dioxygenase-like ring-hydroxylating dioxygenase large terminal subunit